MVINVDDWVETQDGEIVLVLSLPDKDVRTVEVYDPVERTPRQIAVADIRRGFSEVPRI